MFWHFRSLTSIRHCSYLYDKCDSHLVKQGLHESLVAEIKTIEFEYFSTRSILCRVSRDALWDGRLPKKSTQKKRHYNKVLLEFLLSKILISHISNILYYFVPKIPTIRQSIDQCLDMCASENNYSVTTVIILITPREQ